MSVIEKLKQLKWDLKSLLLQLTRYLHDVYTIPPTCHFIHSFFLHKITIKLWVFDHSEPYSSGEFDIHKAPEKFIQIITGYIIMNNEELRLDMFAELNNKNHFITISTDATGKENRMQLNKVPFIRQHAVMCQGTTCFCNNNQTNVIKFSWTFNKWPSEADHLQLACEKGVKNIVKLIRYQCITSINELHSGLTFPSPHPFQDGTVSAMTSFFQTQLSQSFSPIQNLSISKTLSKQKHSGDKQGSQKRSKSNSQKFKLSQQYKTTEEPNKPAISLYESDDSKYSNYIFKCLAITPAGQALSKFTQSPDSRKSIPSIIKELLTALQNAIKAHHSLYLKGNILHRDISENNIIIIKTEKTSDFAEMLINLNLTKMLSSKCSDARHQTDIMKFMTIKVLLSINHTYQHDLKSFFYVLIWLCAQQRWNLCRNPNSRPKVSRLSQWYTDTFEDIAQDKLANMIKTKDKRFDRVLKKFPSAFNYIKPLCESLQGILFPYKKEGRLNTETKKNLKDLYGPILKAFENTIKDSKK